MNWFKRMKYDWHQAKLSQAEDSHNRYPSGEMMSVIRYHQSELASSAAEGCPPKPTNEKKGGTQ